MVGSLTFAFIVFSAAVSFLLPAGLVYLMLHKKSFSWKAFGSGVAVFIVFSQILEKLLHLYVLEWNSTLSHVMKNPWLFALYGALAAGIFEESGRLLAFRYVLRKERKWSDGVSYGLGHGGIEALLIGVIGSVQTIIFASLINNGSFDVLIGSKMPAESAEIIKKTLTGNPWIFALGGWERAVALSLHIGLSLLVLYGVKKGRYKYFIFAVLLHFLFDLSPALYQKGILNIWEVEGIITVLAIPVIWGIFHYRHVFEEEAPLAAPESEPAA